MATSHLTSHLTPHLPPHHLTTLLTCHPHLTPRPKYGSYNPYGTVDRRAYTGSMPRDGLYNYDPYRRGHQEYPQAGGVEDKWRHTYPYVPTSYTYHNPAPRPPPESIGEQGSWWV